MPSADRHGKLNNSLYTYTGHSCGVGASVDLSEGDVGQDDLEKTYAYQEVGYYTNVACRYNHSHALSIELEDTRAYGVTGLLPDSPLDQPEYFMEHVRL